MIAVCVLTAAEANSRFGHVLTSLPKPGGGEYGKYYSLPALNDPRIGKALLGRAMLLLWCFTYALV